MMGIRWPPYEQNYCSRRTHTERGCIGDRQEFIVVPTLDLLMLGTHSKTGAIGDNDDCMCTFSSTLMLMLES